MSALLGVLLGLLPAPFRERFGAELRDSLERDFERASREGVLAAGRFLLTAVLDLARTAIIERFHPSWPEPRRPRAEGQPMLSEWSQDLRHAARTLRRTPAFTLTAASTLALAIGANTGIFSVVKTVLLDPLPFANSERLVAIRATAPGTDLPAEFGVAPEFYLEYRAQSRLLEDLALYNSFTQTLRTEDRVERVRMSTATNSLYSTLGVRPILGRLPVPEDESRVVVISHQLWQSWFGGDPAVIGRVCEVAGARREVIGVMGPSFRFPTDGTLLWIAREIRAQGLEPGDFGDQLVARVAAGVTSEQLAEELTRAASHLPERFGGSPAYVRVIGQHRALVRPLLDHLLGNASQPLWVLLGAVALVLLIACANVTNLFMVRSEARYRDLAVRRAIGATRGRVIRLQLAESLLVALLAGALAVLFAAFAGPALLRAAPAEILRLDQVGLDVATILFALITALLAGLACGALPALRASGSDLRRLREGGRGATAGRLWVRDGLVVGQTALALVLLIGSGLLLRSYQSLRRVDPGYETRDIFTFQFAPEQDQLRDAPSWARFHLDFLRRLAALPGVASVGLVENVPLNEGTRLAPFISGEMVTDPEAGKRLHFTWTAGDYFRTMGIGLLEGRPLEEADHTNGLGNAVISRSAAELLWPGQSPLGHRLQLRGATAWHTVVGVVEDVLQDDFRTPPEALVYLPLAGPSADAPPVNTPAYVVKTARAEVIAPEIRALIRGVAPEAPMYRTYTMAELAADSMAELSFTLLTLGLLSVLALILGAVGLYGVLSYVVAARTREIGVRMALGATAAQVRRMVVAQGVRLVGLSVALGLVVAFASTRVVASLLFGVAAFDAVTFVAMSLSLLGVGLAASYVPARRASSVDPITSLQSE